MFVKVISRRHKLADLNHYSMRRNCHIFLSYQQIRLDILCELSVAGRQFTRNIEHDLHMISSDFILKMSAAKYTKAFHGL